MMTMSNSNPLTPTTGLTEQAGEAAPVAMIRELFALTSGPLPSIALPAIPTFH